MGTPFKMSMKEYGKGKSPFEDNLNIGDDLASADYAKSSKGKKGNKRRGFENEMESYEKDAYKTLGKNMLKAGTKEWKAYKKGVKGRRKEFIKKGE